MSELHSFRPSRAHLSLASPWRDVGRCAVKLRLIRTWAAAPAPLQTALPPLDLGPLLHPPHWRTAQDKQALLQQAVSLASWLADDLRPHLSSLDQPLRDKCTALLQAIDKVIADETSSDECGFVHERPAEHKGRYRIMSAVDLESTFRKHEPDPAVFGSNAVIASTPTRIRAAVALSGSTPDSEAPLAVLAQQREGGVRLPPLLIMDQAGGHGKTRAQVDALSQGQTTMLARIPQAGGADLSHFTPADFRLSSDGASCSCPNGVVSTRSYRKGDGEGVYFRFLASQCRGCALWSECRDSASKPRSHRTVYISPYHLYLRDAARVNASDEGQALLKSRWRVEPTVAWLVRYQGCRRARRVGQAAAECQLLQVYCFPSSAPACFRTSWQFPSRWCKLFCCSPLLSLPNCAQPLGSLAASSRSHLGSDFCLALRYTCVG